ncbi:cyclin-dependent kinase F-4-like [Bidens hawaiensis]|uniref:cyclin-dependent kinase F-4-like n=1 Tax=Bidens hawaiensis TaxID=980011 RepID=UPI00404A28F7
MEKYQIIKLIGRGAFGVVWKAMNKQTSEVVAIKKVDRYNTMEDAINPPAVRSLTKMNNHPNIIKLKEAIRDDEGTLFLVLEYMEYDLDTLMDEIRTEPFSEPEIRNMCFQILQGLAYMHYNGYIHCDLKPANILVSKNNVVKIGDLGSVREADSVQPYPVTTVCYRAPEVCLHAPVYDSSVDMWAVGAIMAELYINEPVFYYEGDVLVKICSVLGTPTETTWVSGLNLARNICYKFQDFPGVRFSELLWSASPDAVNLIASFLSWCPSDRLTAMQALLLKSNLMA